MDSLENQVLQTAKKHVELDNTKKVISEILAPTDLCHPLFLDIYSCAALHESGAAVHGACSDRGEWCGPGQTKFLRQTAVCSRKSSPGTPDITQNNTWFWGVSTPPPKGSTSATSGGAHGFLSALPKFQQGRMYTCRPEVSHTPTL